MATNKYARALLWLRRDLRLHDHRTLAAAVSLSTHIQPVFVFDPSILKPLPRQDRRVEFIWETLQGLDSQLALLNGKLLVEHENPTHLIPKLAQFLGVQAVFCTQDYEPGAITRDEQVADSLRLLGIDFIQTKDQVIFEKREVLTGSGKPFSVFTPYKNAWLKRLMPEDYVEEQVNLKGKLFAPNDYSLKKWVSTASAKLSKIREIGFEPTGLKELGVIAGDTGAKSLLQDFSGRIQRYHETRDFPGVKGVSYLSVHNRFGTVSIREAARLAIQSGKLAEADSGPPQGGAGTWLNELIWRDFYFQILFHQPHVVKGAFRPQYDAIAWEQDETLFRAFCEARTGYPIVDAAMRQLNQTGYMHNRLRMVVASFLTKDLGIDWRWGEAYFAEKLIDFDLAANNGGWQWAASTGCDAQPYFRIFNPVSQSEKFDPQGKFLRRYLPELAKLSNKDIHAPWLARPLELSAAGVRLGSDYPLPIVDHAEARTKTLARFSLVRGDSS